MKASFLLLLIFLTSINSYSQADTINMESQSQNSSNGALADAYLSRSGKWRIYSLESILYKAHNVSMSAIEIEIMNLESRECVAFKKRDTIALMTLWARDFTQDKKQNELVDNKHGLPNFLSLGRVIETFYAIDNNNIVFTSGYESFQEIKDGWKLEPPGTRKYSHTWTRKNGLWKLTTKITD